MDLDLEPGGRSVKEHSDPYCNMEFHPLTLLFGISSVVGKNDTLLADIKYQIDRWYDDINIIIYAIKEVAHISVIEYIATRIRHRRIYGNFMPFNNPYNGFIGMRGFLSDYLNVLYHSNKSTRAYYGSVAAALGYKIIKGHNVRETYITSLFEDMV